MSSLKNQAIINQSDNFPLLIGIDYSNVFFAVNDSRFLEGGFFLNQIYTDELITVYCRRSTISNGSRDNEVGRVSTAIYLQYRTVSKVI